MGADKRFSGGTLQEGPWLRVKDTAQKVIGRRITNLQLDCGIKTIEFNQIRFTKLSGLFWRLGNQRFFQQFADRSEWLDAKLRGTFFRPHVATLEHNTGRLDLSRASSLVASED